MDQNLELVAATIRSYRIVSIHPGGIFLDIERIVGELGQERNRIERAIASLRGSGLSGNGRKMAAGNGRSASRRRMSPAARKHISEMMKKRWAERWKRRGSPPS